MSQLASSYRRAELHAQHEHAVARAVLDSVHAAPPSKHTWTPGDARLLRGIPVVGVHGGLGGAITGSKPHSRTW